MDKLLIAVDKPKIFHVSLGSFAECTADRQMLKVFEIPCQYIFICVYNSKLLRVTDR